MTILILVTCAFSILLRYQVQRSQACLYWGIKISPPEFLESNPRGHQNAISPKSWNLPFFITLVGFIATIGYAFYAHGWQGTLVALAALLAAVISAATIIPKVESKHFFDAILRHLANRSADYTKVGDHQRAEAAMFMFESLTRVKDST